MGVLEAVSQQTVGAKGACHPASSPCRTAQAAMGATTVWERWKQFPNKLWAPCKQSIQQLAMSYGAGCNGCYHGVGVLEAVSQQTVGAMQAIHPAARHVVRRRLQWVCYYGVGVLEAVSQQTVGAMQAIHPAARHVVRRRLQWVCYYGVGVLEAVSQQTVGAKGACHPASSPCCDVCHLGSTDMIFPPGQRSAVPGVCVRPLM